MNPLDNDEMLQVLQQALTKKRVLIIDRHTAARESLRLMLAAIGVTAVHRAGSAAEVIRQVKSNRFDIILSDFVLDDGRDGQQLLEELRHAQLVPLSTVYMIITSERGYTNVVSLAELSPDDYLIKPFVADQLQIRLVKAIYKKHMLRKIYEQIERGSLQEAIAACDQVIQQQPVYMYEALRFKGELLHNLGEHQKAEEVFRKVLQGRAAPWAKMGLAKALRDQSELDEAEQLAEQVIHDAPDYLSAYDFLASVYEAKGKLEAAQDILLQAASVSPHNTLRQRMVGDVAARNRDLSAAERAYSKVVERSRGSSIRTIDDFANLSRVLVERGNVEASRRVLGELKRERRGDKQAELAILINESLCLDHEGASEKAREVVAQALEIQQQLEAEAAEFSQRLAVDLAHACYAAGRQDDAANIMRKVVAENHEDHHLMDCISQVYEKTGQTDTGQALLNEVSQEIIELNDKGIEAAQSGDLEGAMRLMIQAAERMPNQQFLIDAAKSIFVFMDKRGWDVDLAARARDYLQRAWHKDRANPKVMLAREMYVAVAKKYGVSTEPL